MPAKRVFVPLGPDVEPETADDHHRRLVALRDRLTSEMETAPAPYIAALARQLQSVLSELAHMAPPPDPSASKAEEIRLRRIARGANTVTSNPSRAARRRAVQ